MAGIDNKKTITDGIKKAEMLINATITSNLINCCYNLLNTTDFAAEYHNVTGNTFTSYACALYYNGKINSIIKAADFREKPTRVTLGIGEVYDLAQYYGGKAVGDKTYVGETGHGGYYGVEAALNFIKSYQPRCQNGYCIVMVAGTYYSEYLERSKNLNVLTETFMAAPSILLNNLKPIK